MSSTKVIINRENLEDIADAIRVKNGSQDTYKPGEMSEAIDNIEGIEDYYDYTVNNTYQYAVNHFYKKFPTFIIPDNLTQMGGYFVNFTVPSNQTLKLKGGIGLTTLREAIGYANGSNHLLGSNYIIDVSELTISNKVKDMQDMFSYVGAKQIIGLDNIDTSNITNMSYMFNGCQYLISLDLSSWNTSNVTNMSGMFGNGYNWAIYTQEINVSSFTSEKLTNASYMFNGKHASLNKIDLRSMDFTTITNTSNMFGASSSNGIPDACLIIVKDDTQKTWMNTNFSRLTNVQTVAEYESNLNA